MPQLLTQAWTELRPHAEQYKLWTCSKRFVVVPAGRGSGKTELAKRRLVRMLPVRKSWHDPRYFYAAPTGGQAKRIAWQHLKDLTPKEWMSREPLESELTIKTVFGATLCVIGFDKPQRIEGVQWDGGVIDESCDIKPKAFDLTVLPALSHRNGWCWRIGVPKRAGVGAKEYRDYFDRARAGEMEDAAGFTWPSSTVLSPAQLKYAQENMDPKDYREQFEACFETAGGAIFHSFSREYNVRPVTYKAERPIVVGSDFNVDPMCWVLCHRYQDQFEVFDEIVLRNTNTQAALDVLHGRYSQHKGGFEFYGDATAAARKTVAAISDYAQILSDERFKALGRTVHYPRANPKRKDRFACCNAMLCNAVGIRRLFVDPRCKHLIDDLESRYYKPGTCEVEDSGDLGHITDAIGYPVFRLFPIKVANDEPSAIFVTAGAR